MMQVTSVAFHASDSIPSTGTPPETRIEVSLDGRPLSASMNLKKAYIRFTSGQPPRAPEYDAVKGILRLYYDISAITHVHQALKSKTVLVWIGWFDNGHTYAEVLGDGNLSESIDLDGVVNQYLERRVKPSTESE
jgi:hypothetical protein